MENTASYRYERKYYLNKAMAGTLLGRFSQLLRPDAHSGGQYLVSSLYFDDQYNTSLVQKQNGDLMRDKFRLRHYNHDHATLRLERKCKHGEMVYKQQAPLPAQHYGAMCRGDYTFAADLLHHPLWQMFYARHKLRTLLPVANVEYHRQAFVGAAGNVRVTFDTALAATAPLTGAALDVLSPEYTVLEVKYSHFLPSVVMDMLGGLPLTQTDVSKYMISREMFY